MDQGLLGPTEQRQLSGCSNVLVRPLLRKALFDVETSTPEQLSAEPPEEDRTMLQLQRIALRAHQEARQALDLRKDLAHRVMPSHGPYSLGDKVFVWMKDESKKKAEGIWVRGKVVSQEGAMVLVQVHKSLLRVNQSKVRRDHDPWRDVAIPLRLRPHNSVESQVIIVPAVMNMKSVTIPRL